MKQYITIGIASLMLGALAVPTMAAGPVPVEAEAPVVVAPPAPISDFTGFSGGLQFGFIDVETSGVASLSGDEPFLGLRAYYDYDFGQFILGGGLQFDGTDIDLGGVTDVESVLRGGVRGGVDLSRDWIYATLGLARVNTSDGAVGDSTGYFVGLGYEAFVTDQITIGAELLYHEFDDFDLDGLDAEATTAGISVNFRF
ncbi:MAG: outer membrane beta-barrel protein [Pseudomonadota bacterium]